MIMKKLLNIEENDEENINENIEMKKLFRRKLMILKIKLLWRRKWRNDEEEEKLKMKKMVWNDIENENEEEKWY